MSSNLCTYTVSLFNQHLF